MKFDDALRRYRKGVFTDRDVTGCTGLSVRAWRELIKNGAVRTVIRAQPAEDGSPVRKVGAMARAPRYDRSTCQCQLRSAQIQCAW
jgi:hypothetical protein